MQVIEQSYETIQQRIDFCQTVYKHIGKRNLALYRGRTYITGNDKTGQWVRFQILHGNKRLYLKVTLTHSDYYAVDLLKYDNKKLEFNMINGKDFILSENLGEIVHRICEGL